MQIITEHKEIKSLVEGCQQGDNKDQLELYRRFYKMVFSSAYRILNNKMDAEDIMQETFITCYNKIGELKDLNKIGGWLKRMAINKSINHINRDKDKWLTLKNEERIIEEELDDHIFDELELKRIYREIENLPDGYRVILNLYLIEGYDHEEIAEILKIKSSTSRSQYTRARQKLKKILLEKYER